MKPDELDDLELETLAAAAGSTAKGLTCGAACATCEICKMENLPDDARPNLPSRR